MRSFPSPFCCSPPKGKGAWCASMALSPWATFAGSPKASLHPSKRGFPLSPAEKNLFLQAETPKKSLPASWLTKALTKYDDRRLPKGDRKALWSRPQARSLLRLHKDGATIHGLRRGHSPLLHLPFPVREAWSPTPPAFLICASVLNAKNPNRRTDSDLFWWSIADSNR